MKKIDLASIKNIQWSTLLRKNKYAIVSVVISVLYFSTTFFAISFIIRDIRDAFSINDSNAKKQIIGFDLETYQKIAPRFDNNQIK